MAKLQTEMNLRIFINNEYSSTKNISKINCKKGLRWTIMMSVFTCKAFEDEQSNSSLTFLNTASFMPLVGHARKNNADVKTRIFEVFHAVLKQGRLLWPSG